MRGNFSDEADYPGSDYHWALRALVHCVCVVLSGPCLDVHRAWNSGTSFDHPSVGHSISHRVRETLEPM